MAAQTETRILERAVTGDELQEILEHIPSLLDRIELTEDDKKRTAKEYTDLLGRLKDELAQNRAAHRTGYWRKEVVCEWRGDLLVDPNTDAVVDTREE